MTSTQLKDSQSLQSARQQVSSAQLGLKSTIARITLKQAPPTPAALAQARGGVVQAQIALANAQKALAETTLRAPIAGVVAAVNGTVGTQASGGGSSSSNPRLELLQRERAPAPSSWSSGFVTLTDVKGMQVVAGFSETDAAKIRVGQAATVTVDALPNEKLAAHVIAIAPTRVELVERRHLHVTFVLDRSEPGLKPGMTANVDVVIAEADNVLHVADRGGPRQRRGARP